MRLLLAPNAFKGSFSSVRVARVWEAALRPIPGWETVSRPLSDGGDSALEVWQALVPSTRRLWFVARDALGERRRVPVLWEPADGRPHARGYIETALACGIARLAPTARDPLRATTFGCGQLLLGLLEQGAREIALGLGGSATVDGGLGVGRALGYRFLAAGGAEVETPRALADLERIVAPAERPWEEARIRALCDVRAPLLGPEGAVAVFGPQKFAPGAAGPEPLARLERGLERVAERMAADLGRNPREAPGAGAAGGLGAGLAVFAGAALESGAEHFLGLAGVADFLAPGPERVDAVLTGEGSYDAQSGQGKLAGELRALCRRAGVPLAVVAGRAPGATGEAAVDDRPLVLTAEALGRSGARRLDERELAALAIEAVRRLERGVAGPHEPM